MVEKLELALIEKGWTQSALEKAAMLSPNRISKWKGGQGEPTARQALRMAQLLELPVAYLIDDDQAQPEATPLNDLEREIWRMVRMLGGDEAYRRLIQAPVDMTPHMLPPPPRPKLQVRKKGDAG